MLGNLAICDILLGKINLSGRLPFTVARNAGQLPIFYNHYFKRGNYGREGNQEKPGQDYVFGPNSLLFPFGIGLSYSHFLYRELDVQKKGEDGVYYDYDFDIGENIPEALLLYRTLYVFHKGSIEQ